MLSINLDASKYPGLLHVWTCNTNKGRNACSYYRIEVPLSTMAERKLVNIYEDQADPNPITQRNSALALMYSDVMHQYALAGTEILRRYQAIRRRKPAMHGDVLVTPPAIIYDIDDNADFVHPFHSTFVDLGVRAYPDAHLLTPGDVLVFEDWKGETRETWIDQETVYDDKLFDISRNLFSMKLRHQVIREANAATVSCRALASYFKDVIGQPNVYIYPNTIVPGHFEYYDVARKDDKVRILWQGGQTHYIDWWPLRDALKRVAEKYRGKVTFVMFGAKFDWVNSAIPDDMIEFHYWSLYEAYKLKRGLLNIDINLCPLVDNVFNRCKSAIKWYEASIWLKPEATLAQKTEPYHEIEHDKTGLLFSTNDEFVEMLSGLIENADLRRRLGAGAKQWVLANRTPDVTAPALHEYYTDVRNRQRVELGITAVKTFSVADLKKETNGFLTTR